MKLSTLTLATILLANTATMALNQPAQAVKHYTVTQRQDALRKEVDSGQKKNELTLKEASKLRDRLTDVNNRILKMKAKNGGQLSYKDEGKVEKDLNSISVDMQKQKLQKRVQSK